MTANQGGQKNRNGKMTVVIFCIVSTSVWTSSNVRLYFIFIFLNNIFLLVLFFC